MALVYVSVGSNIQQEQRICACLTALQHHFGELQLSPVYESEAIGFSGDNFYNLVVGFNSALAVGALSQCLRAIETANDRSREGPKFSARTLDIDILTYDNLSGVVDGINLPRDEILDNAFVLLPLADVAPQAKHPLNGQTYQALWQAYDQQKQKLWRIDFTWQGINL